MINLIMYLIVFFTGLFVGILINAMQTNYRDFTKKSITTIGGEKNVTK